MGGLGAAMPAALQGLDKFKASELPEKLVRAWKDLGLGDAQVSWLYVYVFVTVHMQGLSRFDVMWEVGV